jgi:hypothetical protein
MKQPEFILQSTVTSKKDSDDNTKMVLTGVASTRNPSLYGEVMSTSALEQMCADAIGLPILADHKGELDAVLGVIENAYIKNDELHIDFSILPKHQATIQEYIDNNISLGLSIGGVAQVNYDTNIVDSITLIEVSITPVPANRDCHATVSVKQNIVSGGCLYGVCDALIKQNFKEDEIISQEEPQLEEIQRAKPTTEGDVNSEEKSNNEEEPKEDEPLTVKKVKEMMDERFAEEKQAIVETVINEVKNMSNNKGEVKQSAEPEPVDTPVEPTVNIELNTDEIVEKLSAKIFDGLTERRDVSNTKMEQSIKEDEPVEPEVKKFTSAEAAEMIIQNMDSTDPLVRAINQSLKQ